MTGQHAPSSLTGCLARSALKAGFVFALVVLYAIPTALLSKPMIAVAPVPAPVHIGWSAVYAEQFPGCVGHGAFLPARIVVVAREGAARTMPYSDATVARINATWENDNAWDDLYTVGKCAR